MFIVKLWKERYYKRSGGINKPPKTVENPIFAKKFETYEEARQIPRGKIYEI